MQVVLGKELVKQITVTKLRPFGINESNLDWTETVTFNLYPMSKQQILKLRNLIHPYESIRGTKIVLKDLDTWLDVLENKSPKIRKLQAFTTVLIHYLLDVDGHRVFMRDHTDDTAWLCYRVTEVRYHQEERGSGYYHPAHVILNLAYDMFGQRHEQVITFYHADVYMKNVVEILARKGIYAETKELREAYLNEVARYRELIALIGKQFLADGIGTDDIPNADNYDRHGHYRGRGNIFNLRENRVVIDIFNESDVKEDRERHVDLGGWFWTANRIQRTTGKTEEEVQDTYGDSYDRNIEDEDSEKEQLNIEVPVHQKLVVFDLQAHRRLAVHVNYLTEYVYDKTLSDKLVLPDELKTLVQILIEHKEGDFRDIVEHKGGGAVILLTGKAGVGKTLTAEVFAEAKEKPLYSVQASQLGINPEDLEKELTTVLKRAARWNAILLLDEADVYVHERGNDLNQNAIVGVFLRVLEYHASIMFMTTNRPDIVDDAIASRCVARIDYEYPTIEDQKKIWRILADISSIALSDEVIHAFVAKHNEFSGRDIKNLLKLANLKAKSEGTPITLETIVYVIRFKPTLTGGS